MRSLVEIFNEGHFWAYYDGCNEDKMREMIKTLDCLKPHNVEYWKIRAEVLDLMARNTIELLERGKRGEGMIHRRLYDRIRTELIDREWDYRDAPEQPTS